MDWYLIHTKPRQEFRAEENLRNQNFEIFLPTIPSQKLIKNKLCVHNVPLFSRYLFIRLDQIQSNWYPIKSTLGVQQLVKFGVNTSPTKVPNQLIEELKIFCKQQISPQELYKSGSHIHIRDGAFKGLDGNFQQLLENPSGELRALVLIDFLGKVQAIPIPVADIKIKN